MLSKILEIIKLCIKVDLAYLADAWGAMLSTIFQIFVFYYIWMAVYNVDYSLNGITKDQIVTYIILSRIIYSQITYGFIQKIGTMIHTGAISMEMLRPMDFISMMFFERVGDFLAFATLTGLPALIIAAIFLGLDAPYSLHNGIFFVVSLILAVAISFFFDFFIGLLTFYTNYSWGLQTFQEAFISLFSGALIPIAFFPDWLKIIANVLPFQQMSYSPVSIYLGLVQGNQVYHILFIQLIWLVVMVVFTKLFYSFAIKKITVQGG